MIEPATVPESAHIADQYLRFIGRKIRHYPRRKTYKEKDWIRPKLFSFFGNLINSRLKDVTLTLGEGLEQNPSWSQKKDLRAFAIHHDLFPQEDHRLITETLERAKRTGYLREPESERVCTTLKMIRNLIGSASDCYQHLTGEPAPDDLTKIDSKQWRAFNEMIQLASQETNRAWRNLRITVHNAIWAVRGSENQTDPMGYNPEYWAIMNFVVLLGPVTASQCHAAVEKYDFTAILDEDRITPCIGQLCNDGILRKDRRFYSLSPALSETASAFARAVREQYPLLQEKAKQWPVGEHLSRGEHAPIGP